VLGPDAMRSNPVLRGFDESVCAEDAVQSLSDGTSIRLFLADHNHQILTIEENVQVVLGDELSG
jgi:hypothetical protein